MNIGSDDCIDCNENLEFDDFHSNKKSSKGCNKCKNCVNEKVKCIDCAKYIHKTNISEHTKRRHQEGELRSEDIRKAGCGSSSNNIDNTNRTLIASSCFGGKTYLMMNKVLVGELNNADRKIKI